MVNKRGAEFSLQFAMSLVLTLIVVVSLGACTYKYFNPNCDPSSADVFNKFIGYYDNCITLGNCGKFSFSEIDVKDSIIVKPEGEKLENTQIILECNGRESFFKRGTFKDTKLCFSLDKNLVDYATDPKYDFLRLSTLPTDISNVKSEQYVGTVEVELVKVEKDYCFLHKSFEISKPEFSGIKIIHIGLLKVGDSEKFTFNNKQYDLEIISVEKSKLQYLDLLIKNDKIEATVNDIKVSETVLVDLDKDGADDIQIKVTNIERPWIEVGGVAGYSPDPVASLEVYTIEEEKNEQKS